MARKAKVLAKHAPPKDFAKEKRKVGKKKTPKNETNTNFTVKQVRMPAQGGLQERGPEITHRGLGLLELLAHLGHHNSKVRRDAYFGLRELCASHEGVLRSNLARVLDATTSAPTDGQAEVRAAFRVFQAWLLEAVAPHTAAAFSATLALHVRSALSHVNAEVREDGLSLLQLYLARLGCAQIFSQSEIPGVIETLCQLSSAPTEAVLPCIYQLLQEEEARASGAGGRDDATFITEPAQAPQAAIDDVLHRRLRFGDGMPSSFPSTPDRTQGTVDSPLWACCLRTWLQAGDSPPGTMEKPARQKGEHGQLRAKLGCIRLRCAAVMERALSLLDASAGDKWDVSLRPSPSQVATLVAVVRRGEWPLRVDARGSLRVLVDSTNLRFARVFARLAAGAAPAAAYAGHLARLAVAALQLLAKPDAPWGTAVAPNEGFSGEAVASQLALVGATARSHALRTLGLLWACCSETGGGLLSADNVGRLIQATSQLAVLDLEGVGVAWAIAATPLTAALLGLLRLGETTLAPASLRGAWPEALEYVAPCGFAATIEAAEPGVAASWVALWPQLLWHLQGSDSALSAFLLELLLSLARQASQKGSVHEGLLAKLCPLLVPFFAGRPGSDLELEPPPLAKLSPEDDGPQTRAALLLRHFPRFTEPLVSLLGRSLCRWSDAGAAGGCAAEVELASARSDAGAGGSNGFEAQLPPARFGPACSELMLETLLAQRDSVSLTLRFRIALTALRAVPANPPLTVRRSALGERCALRLLASVVEWLMGEVGTELDIPCRGGGIDERRRLVLQCLAWPLCQKVLAGGAALAPRALCFFALCAAQLPPGGFTSEGADENAAQIWLELLGESFNALVLTNDALGTALSDLAAAGLSEALAGRPFAAQSKQGGLARSLAMLLVASWMRLVPQPDRPAAYELLAKLCAQRLLAPATAAVGAEGAAVATGVAGGGAAGELAGKRARTDGGNAVEEERESPRVEDRSHTWARTACAAVLVELIAYRNEHGFATEAWGREPLPGVEGEVSGLTAGALRARLAGRSMGALSGVTAEPAGIDVALAALTPLL